MSNQQSHPFETLSPEFICDAIDSIGLQADARLLALNSYENRVYQVGLEDRAPIIAKFYRPERWSVDQIHEEHAFSHELAEAEIDVIAPLVFDNTSLFQYQGFQFALFDRVGGHAPNLEDPQMLDRLGRLLGRMHAIARQASFKQRPSIDTSNYAEESISLLLARWIPCELQSSYESLSRDILVLLKSIENRSQQFTKLRSHGDFHLGNMLQQEERVMMLDLDDTRSACAIQDIWMLLSGSDDDMRHQLDTIIRNYEMFHDFNWQEAHLVEYYRTLRLLHHSAWLASRWDDPAFPMAFPWFNTGRYWSEQILTLREQLYGLQQSEAALAHG